MYCLHNELCRSHTCNAGLLRVSCGFLCTTTAINLTPEVIGANRHRVKKVLPPQAEDEDDVDDATLAEVVNVS